jgi:hypothetical protein
MRIGGVGPELVDDQAVGHRRRVDRPEVAESEPLGVRPAEVEGALVHVDGPHGGRGGAAGQRAGDGSIAAAEVDQRAGGHGRRASSKRCLVPVSMRSGENTPRSVTRVSERSGRSSRTSFGADRLLGLGSK